MDWPHGKWDCRDKPDSPQLSGYDRRVLERLLKISNMEDVSQDLHRMSASGRKGGFEQETRPTLLIL